MSVALVSLSGLDFCWRRATLQYSAVCQLWNPINCPSSSVLPSHLNITSTPPPSPLSPTDRPHPSNPRMVFPHSIPTTPSIPAHSKPGCSRTTRIPNTILSHIKSLFHSSLSPSYPPGLPISHLFVLQTHKPRRTRPLVSRIFYLYLVSSPPASSLTETLEDPRNRARTAPLRRPVQLGPSVTAIIHRFEAVIIKTTTGNTRQRDVRLTKERAKHRLTVVSPLTILAARHTREVLQLLEHCLCISSVWLALAFPTILLLGESKRRKPFRSWQPDAVKSPTRRQSLGRWMVLAASHILILHYYLAFRLYPRALEINRLSCSIIFTDF